MARAKKRTPQVEEVRPYVEGVAKNLVDKLYGPNGPAWGTQLTEIEDVLLEIREVLTEKMLDVSLAQQAAAPASGPQPYAPARAVSNRWPVTSGQPAHRPDAGRRGRVARAGRLL